MWNGEPLSFEQAIDLPSPVQSVASRDAGRGNVDSSKQRAPSCFAFLMGRRSGGASAQPDQASPRRRHVAKPATPQLDSECTPAQSKGGPVEGEGSASAALRWDPGGGANGGKKQTGGEVRGEEKQEVEREADENLDADVGPGDGIGGGVELLPRLSPSRKAIPSSALTRVTDCSQVDMMSLWYNSGIVGMSKSLGLPRW